MDITRLPFLFPAYLPPSPYSTLQISPIQPSTITFSCTSCKPTGSPTYSASKSLRAKLEREYTDLSERVFDKQPEKFPKDKFTLEMFLWAFVMLFSRAARLSLKIGKE